MVFASPVFLFLFLPIVLLAYYLIGIRFRNALLLVASLFFYAWGERTYCWVMLLSILMNYGCGILLDRYRSHVRVILTTGIVLNLGLLIFFKYAVFIAKNVNMLAHTFNQPDVFAAQIHLPIGISFFTFHGLSYLIDVYRGDARVQKNATSFGLYISFFPQLIAGPIIRYKDVDEQLRHRNATFDEFTLGVERFITGLGKKILIANVLAVPADVVFNAPGSMSAGAAWIGVICYSLQIYFDFSGYSDMAIGLAHMFGIKFRENFNYPYVSRSINEFWRRWHISLSSWFRDYLYIPLGGNRKGGARIYFNLVTVFFLCGLWHGAAWTFIAWGLYHGALLVIERVWLGQWLEKTPRAVCHGYALLAIAVGWVPFRAEGMTKTFAVLRAMFGFSSAEGATPVLGVITGEGLLCMCFGIVMATPLLPKIRSWLSKRSSAEPIHAWASTAGSLTLLAVLFLCVLRLAAGTHNPFIYFRF